MKNFYYFDNRRNPFGSNLDTRKEINYESKDYSSGLDIKLDPDNSGYSDINSDISYKFIHSGKKPGEGSTLGYEGSGSKGRKYVDF